MVGVEHLKRLRLWWSHVNKGDFFAFVVILLLSAAFWLMLALNDEYEQEVAVNLRLKNVPKTTVITTDLPSTFSATLKDKGVTLFTYKQKVPTVVVNFEDYDQTSGHVVLKTSELSKLLKQKLEATTEIVQVGRGEQLEYFYTTSGRKVSYPVRLQSQVTADSIHVVAALAITPDSVDVYAPEEVYDTLEYVQTEVLQLQDLTDDYEGKLALATIRGAKCEPAEVKVSIDVDRVTEKTVSVPVEGVNFPADKQLKAFPSKVNVVFQVGTTMYKQITAQDFKIVVSYEDLLQQTDGTIRLHLKSVPDGVSHVRLSPSRIEFLLEDVSESEE